MPKPTTRKKATTKRRPERATQYKNPTYLALLGNVAANLQNLRREKHWTQEEAAHRCGMVVQTYQNIEGGRKNLTFTTLARLAEGFSVTAVELIQTPETTEDKV